MGAALRAVTDAPTPSVAGGCVVAAGRSNDVLSKASRSAAETATRRWVNS